MGKIKATLDRFQPCILSVMRFVYGLLFLQHGMQKVMGFPPRMPRPGAEAMPPQPVGWYLDLSTRIGWSGALEFFGGILLVFGLCTRPVAFLLSGEMAIAYFSVHAKMGFFPIRNGGDAAIMYCFVFLYLVFAGGGPLSIDALIGRNKTPDQA